LYVATVTPLKLPTDAWQFCIQLLETKVGLATYNSTIQDYMVRLNVCDKHR